MAYKKKIHREKIVLSVVVPAFNEEEVILETHSRIEKSLTELQNKKLIDNFEVIYVDDGSTDNTLSIMEEISCKSDKVKILSLSGNFGHQAALIAGLRHTVGDAAVSLDADLQDPPEVIEKMITRFSEGCEIVYGVRTSRIKDTGFKRVTAWFFYKIMQLMGVNIITGHADFRLLSRNVLRELNKFTEVNLFLRGLIPQLGFKQCVVEYERDARFAGATKYPLKKMLSFAAEGITSFSYVPLRIATFGGLSISFVSGIMVVWAFISKLAGKVIPGWSSTVIPLFFFSGIQLMVLGIIGEYIGKIYIEVKRRPHYIIRDKYNFKVRETSNE